MKRYKVIQEFTAQEHNGPFYRTISAREELAFFRYAGTDNEAVIFAVLINGTEGNLVPGPHYETGREVFEASTEIAQP